MSRLGEREFEHLSQALAIAILGRHVEVFGDGPDGGREATFNGLTNYPSPDEGVARWNGYGLVQAKYRRRLRHTESDSSWLLDQIKREMNIWADADSSRRKKATCPNTLFSLRTSILRQSLHLAASIRLPPSLRASPRNSGFKVGPFGMRIRFRDTWTACLILGRHTRLSLRQATSSRAYSRYCRAFRKQLSTLSQATQRKTYLTSNGSGLANPEAPLTRS